MLYSKKLIEYFPSLISMIKDITFIITTIQYKLTKLSMNFYFEKYVLVITMKRKLISMSMITASLLLFIVLSSVAISNANAIPPQSATLTNNNSVWHAGSNKNTREANVVYTETVDTSLAGQISSQHQGNFYQKMLIEQNDPNHPDDHIGFTSVCAFNTGGLDTANKKVADWGKCIYIEPTLKTEILYKHGKTTASVFGSFKFQSFYIVKGNAEDVVYVNQTLLDHNDKPYWIIRPANDSIVGQITFYNQSTYMSDVILTPSSGESYNFDAQWNVSINATIGSNWQTFVEVPALISFKVSHLGTTETIKYGLSLDWSSNLNFPIGGGVTVGDNITLVSDERAHIGVDGREITTFQPSNAQNKSFFFKEGSDNYASMTVPDEFNLLGSTVKKDTIRTYVENALISIRGDEQSKIYVAFGGLTYGVSTGIEYDPSIDLFTGDGGSIPGYSFEFLALSAVIGILGVVAIIKKRRQL
jgi:hypothetical protein